MDSARAVVAGSVQSSGWQLVTGGRLLLRDAVDVAASKHDLSCLHRHHAAIGEGRLQRSSCPAQQTLLQRDQHS
jgi:hypothetical protein